MKDGLPTGIVRTPSGYRTVQWVPDPARPNGQVKTKRWRHDAAIKDMVAWREAQRVLAKQPELADDAQAVITGFAGDVATYLEARRAMPSYSQRARHMAEWLIVFGDEPIAAITPVRIQTQRDRLLTVGPKHVLQKASDGGAARWVELPIPLSASSVNNRLRALENFFTVMYPKEPNPVRAVSECEEPDPEPRGLTFMIGLEILSFMPDITKPLKDGTHETGSLSRARFEAMLWTGLPPVQLARLKPELVDWHAGTVLVPRRQKGRPARRARRRREQPRPLLPQALAALQRFFALSAQHDYPWASSLGKSVKRAVRAANDVRAGKGLPLIPETATVYDLTRHTFGTEAMRASQNLAAVQALMGHADINQTARYALAAVRESTAAAVEQLRAYAGGFVGQPVRDGKVSPPKASRREHSRRKTTRGKA